MATKDWKKVGKTSWDKIDYNGKVLKWLRLQKITVVGNKKMIKMMVPKQWLVNVYGSNISTIEKKFKTKPQAAKYAKAYMIRH